MKLTHTHRLPLVCFLATSLFVCMQSVEAGLFRAGAANPQEVPTVSTDTTKGISLYDRGAYQEAVAVFQLIVKRRKDDLVAWHYLGLSFEKLNQPDEARKAHEKAARLGTSLVQGAVKKHSDYVSSLRAQNAELMQAAESAERYLKLAHPTRGELDEWTERSRSLQELLELVSAEGQTAKIYTPKEVTEKARVLDVPEPLFIADKGPSIDPPPPKVIERVTVRGIFTADGKVRGVFLVGDSYHEFALACIKAARKIRFTPATKDGQLVATYMTFEFNSVEQNDAPSGSRGSEIH